jgi:hypothetical protein
MARVTGNITFDTSDISNDAISATTLLDNDKLQHLYKIFTNFDLAVTGTPVARHEIVYVVDKAGTIRNFNALCYDTGTSASVTFDLKKNGVSVLSSVVTITNATSDRAVVAGTISTATLAIGDVLTIELAVSSSTGMQGPFAWAVIEENGAPT